MAPGIHDTAFQTTGLAASRPLADPEVSSAIEPSTTVAGGKLGRFMILEPLGSGAMGVVYTAYDETLDRKVAVKVLRDTGESAQRRLLREAQAMARVSHPNVVTVLEAGMAGGQVYVAMEFIRGQTLGAWLQAAPRSWQEVVEVFVQAGRGLAAAHAAGLVHRDFKPSNVMIDDAGRARVLDFGLVRAAVPELPRAAPTPGTSNSNSKLDMHLTHDDQIVGTPAYMAPEHWRGLSPEPAADQFSFCVALYESLYGVPPFPYTDAADLVLKVLHGQISEPPRKRGLPAWLSPVVMRGLKNDPKDRYPGMPALLSALDRGRARGRRRWVVAAVLAGAVVGTGVVLARTSDDRTCTGAPEELAQVWGQAQRDAVATALGAAAPGYASVVWPRVQEELDGYAADWRSVHREACLAHRHGERSGALLDQQMRCLDQRRGALAETVTTLAAADADVALRALEVAGDLPSLEGCRNLEALSSEQPPPDDPESAARVAELRGQMTQAQVLARSGRLPDALARANEVVAASEALDYPPVHAEALLLRSKLALHLPEQAGADVERLTQAISAGFEARADGIAAEALALRIYALARQPDQVARALADEPLALALADRSPTPAALRGLVLNNIGTAYLARQEPAQARRYFTEALAVREVALGSEDAEVAYTLVNLALASDPGPERERLLARAVTTFELALGPAHPATIEGRLVAVHLVDFAAGPGLLRPGCAALDRFLPGDVVGRARCLLYLGRLALELGDDDEAELAFVAGASLVDDGGRKGPQLTDFEVGALVGYAALDTGAHEAAIRRIEAALQLVPQAWWSRADAAELRTILGHNLLAAGRPEQARDNFVTAIADYQGLIDSEPRFGAALARTRRGLVEALVALNLAQTPEARENLAASLEFYRSAGSSFRRQLARTERLVAVTGTPTPIGP
ncbi:Serine/threonine protein kinase [Nannocystis exedens]|uniref:Serine/threonine protein kinase n=1 Tax=Nannocystis exedens TaxID=54 RepID=A0A1I1YP64_9BACT|nr:serine/threonine-protein kinase [Nannocystis exedens]PCC70247.1 serine/threonine protein kinase [Nannocystis exedens]SFE21219.1 Serine/threonine protein kinase [Nannocystis exedens]